MTALAATSLGLLLTGAALIALAHHLGKGDRNA